jgi:hypothetical protein
MAKLTRKAKRTTRARSLQSRIPEPFQTIEAAQQRKHAVPKLILSGEWLKAVGFPIGSAAVLTTDRRGEMTLHRLGLGFPRRLFITAERRRAKRTS